jgi:hypothetical protein
VPWFDGLAEAGKTARIAIATAVVLTAAAWIDFALSQEVRPNLPAGHPLTHLDRLSRDLLFAFPIVGFVAIAAALTAFVVAHREPSTRRWAIAAAYVASSAPVGFFVFIVYALRHLN